MRTIGGGMLRKRCLSSSRRRVDRWAAGSQKRPWPGSGPWSWAAAVWKPWPGRPPERWGRSPPPPIFRLSAVNPEAGSPDMYSDTPDPELYFRHSAVNPGKPELFRIGGSDAVRICTPIRRIRNSILGSALWIRGSRNFSGYRWIWFCPDIYSDTPDPDLMNRKFFFLKSNRRNVPIIVKQMFKEKKIFFQ